MAVNKVFGMLGLAAKAGKIGSGSFVTEKLIKENRAYLCIVAKDASANTTKDFRDMCAYYKVPFCAYSDRETLGAHIGKESRVVLAVTDKGFAEKIEALIRMEEIDG